MRRGREGGGGRVEGRREEYWKEGRGREEGCTALTNFTAL